MLELFLGGQVALKLPVGQVVFNNNSSSEIKTNWVVPKGVTSISAVAVGSGGGSPMSSTSASSAGGNGGNLRWRNNIAVTPGETLIVTVGRPGFFGGSGTVYGNPVSISRGSTILLLATGGGYSHPSETLITAPNCGGGNGGVGYGGYAGRGGGGGGAGGYTGAGGNGTNFSGTGTAGSGGGGGGGAGYYYNYQYYGSSGGSVGLNGRGGNGAGGIGGGSNSGNFGSGTAGSGGDYSSGLTAARYGAGAGSNGTERPGYAVGGQGGLRIIWGPNRAYPSSGTADQTVVN